MQKTNHLFIAILALCLILLNACSGLHAYKNTMEKNLLVKTKTDSGSFFTSVKARVDIYAVDDTCKLTYLGTINLKNKEVPIGLPNSSPTYLDFVFSSSNFLANARGSTAFDVYLTPRSGYEYLAEASYLDGIYNVVIKERKTGSNQTKELEHKDCRPQQQ
ncbi:MAG: hypothetical protein PVH87_18015 [Desulfobacteraceae bacterium]|jgi:hypothetical protein